jgi:DNA-binding MarR family transcriptional regulator
VDEEQGHGLDLDVCDAHRADSLPSDINWLLHRAAQRFGDALEVEAKRHGVGLRGQLVLSSLKTECGRTQLALGAALFLDKTTLTTVLDKLERDGLVRRRPDPADRRVRIPEITEAGIAVQEKVAEAIGVVERGLLGSLGEDEQKLLEVALRRVVDHNPADTLRPGGSCM